MNKTEILCSAKGNWKVENTQWGKKGKHCRAKMEWVGGKSGRCLWLTKDRELCVSGEADWVEGHCNKPELASKRWLDEWTPCYQQKVAVQASGQLDLRRAEAGKETTATLQLSNSTGFTSQSEGEDKGEMAAIIALLWVLLLPGNSYTSHNLIVKIVCCRTITL